MHSPETEPRRPPLVIILGPTAVGKTEISIQLARRLDGEIISADSRLFYRGMDIGTAKPSPEERRAVPHHLIDVADPREMWSLALFQEQARQIIAQVHQRGHLPFLVGGTGQYIRAVTQGWQPPAVQPDARLRRALESWAQEIGALGLHARLALLDEEAAAKIDPRNLRRTVRALEVILSSGRRFSAQRRSGDSPYDLLQLGLTRPRAELYARIDQRIDKMLQEGLVDEVRGLLAQGIPPDAPAFSAIGYRQILAHLQGQLTLDEAVAQIKRATRVFVRRQANWFKPEEAQIRWFTVGANTAEEMEAEIRRWLADRASAFSAK